MNCLKESLFLNYSKNKIILNLDILKQISIDNHIFKKII